MKTQKINHLAVWICIIASQCISVLWYSPLLFANTWMDYLGKRFEDFDGESIGGLVFSIIGAVSFNYFLAWLFKRLQVDRALKGFQFALVIALCCFCFQTLTQDSFSLRPLGLSLINSGSILLNFSLSGIILGGWKTYDKNKK
jgi:hypothetical protein